MKFYDTIVAQATPYGRSGIGILRISGLQAKYVAYKILKKIPPARYAYYTPFLDISGLVIDEGIAVWYPKPFSFTGEDILELQGHGNPVILDLLIKNILCIKNVRVANPGEFTQRAFLNGKLDLIQSESIIKLIHADSELSIKAALRSLQGFFSKKINDLIKKIVEMRMLVEANINFPEENVDINIHRFAKKLKMIFLNTKEITKTGKLGNKIHEGMKVVIIGPSNSGKSSLYNALLLNNSAIVTDIQGTTRDVLHDDIYIDGITFQITDTAGFRPTNNIIEKIGISKTWEQIELSDHILFVVDNTLPKHTKREILLQFLNQVSYKKNITILFNKCDISQKKSKVMRFLKKYIGIRISAKTGEGINILKMRLKKQSLNSITCNSETVFLARRRHLKILELVIQKILHTQNTWKMDKNIEILAENLKNIQNMLNEITGLVTSDTILNSIFSNFCIGK
ncbi:tRNA uridine-5-carboxymethylaminomethyl(34) synthesis GTPase MnmE [Buchnera aphidicola]|uniref:tRNA uridine-5-carboxymethylaminomethyl(34) synthesis GTPase MnmE n=1 Tax=Buchnera aphidicola TaxID=9 RepID=UPI0034649B92